MRISSHAMMAYMPIPSIASATRRFARSIFGSIVACTPAIAAAILPAEAVGMRLRERRITRWCA